MENNIKVSVIVPIYNAYDYLRQALDSIVAQTLTDIEIICIDDGSTDRSLDIIKEYQQSDARVRIVTENNAGPATARNKGIARAKGEYMIFLDADDFYEPQLLSELYRRASEEQLDITLANFDIYNNKSQKFTPATLELHSDIFEHGVVASKNEYPDYIFESATGYVWNKLFSTEFVREKELAFAPELYVFEDVCFVTTALSLAERVGRVDTVMIHHRVYSEQQRAKLFKKYYTQVPVVYLRIKDFLTQHGMYIPLMRGFINFSAGRCYKIYNLLWSDAKSSFWDLLHSGYADSLGWFRQASSDFEDADVAEFVASVGLYTHKQYTKRISHGVHVKPERISLTELKRRIKNVHIREKINKFFANRKKKKNKNGEENTQ
ncbi:MAG: glycosyltransferase family 2 protein [Clostridia bacterium]|nr:glycosyltransferase family 2 protein [Clostridia bacterium]